MLNKTENNSIRANGTLATQGFKAKVKCNIFYLKRLSLLLRCQFDSRPHLSTPITFSV